MGGKRASWIRPTVITLAVFAAWFAISVLFYQDGPDDTPMIVSLLSK